MKLALHLVLLILIPQFAVAQVPSAKKILKKSQAFHDPKDILSTKRVSLVLNEPRPGGSDRIAKLIFDLNKEFFAVERTIDKDVIYMEENQSKFTFKFNGISDIPSELSAQYNLNEERLTLMKNYYLYLWLLPVKLNDPGTIIHPNVEIKDFFGKKGYELKVSYTEAVGKDTWYFYFDQESYEMIGYRFYHDESKNDGEYILLENEVREGKLRIPAIRKWYKHQKDEYLGEDQLKKIVIELDK